MKRKMTIKTVILGLAMFLFTSAFAGADEDLLKACKQGDLEGVKSAIAAGANVNKLDNGNAPIASAFFWADITKLLLEKGADPNLGDYPALIQACNNYSYEVAKILLDAGADPNKVGITDPANTFRTLIANEKAKGKDANQASINAWESLIPTMKKTETELVRVIVQQTNCAPCLKLVLDKGAKIDFKDGTNALETFANFSMTKAERINAFKTGASNMAAFGLKVPDWYSNLPDNLNSEPVEMLELILSKGADINKPFKDGMTALTTALRSNGKLHASKALMTKGADPKVVGIQTVGSTKITHYPVCHAAQQGDIELMGQMLSGGADINSNATSNSLINADGTWGGNGYTPLNIALMTKNFSVAKLLIDKGADLKIGTNGYASMETTGNKGCKGVVEVKNKTAIYWAIESGNIELIKLIADKTTWQINPDFSYKTISGNCEGKGKLSPSSYASRLDNKEASSYLTSKGM